MQLYTRVQRCRPAALDLHHSRSAAEVFSKQQQTGPACPSPSAPHPAEAPDLDAYLGKVPLHHLETIFRTPEDMQRGLPPALYQSFRAVSDGVARMVAAATAAAQEAAPAAAPGAPGEQWLPLLRLPWRERGKGGADHATRDAAAWLGQQVEAAEVAKAHLRWANEA